MCIDMGKTEGLFNSNTDNETTLLKLRESSRYFEEVWNAFWCPRTFSDVFIFLMQTITMFCDACFMRIINEWYLNLILSVYVTYFFSKSVRQS